jgi:hypothetical protein
MIPSRRANKLVPKYTRPSREGAWWVPLLEKASAKFYGNYERMSGGWMAASLYILTGMPSG